MTDKEKKNHWIIRVNDGENFRNSKYPFWGVKRGHGGGFKTIVKKFKPGDILWFLTSKKYGAKLIGMSEYTHYYDRADEPLIKINTLSNIDQNWKGEDNWDIQIHYINLYDTEPQNISITIQCGSIIMEYSTFIDKIEHDLYTHYKNYTYYTNPIIFPF
jgi:hypothetical protein